MCSYINKARPIAAWFWCKIDGHIKLIQICIIALPHIHVPLVSGYLHLLVVTFNSSTFFHVSNYHHCIMVSSSQLHSYPCCWYIQVLAQHVAVS